MIAQIESARGIENAEAIVAEPGVDVVWLGQFDLTLVARHPRPVRPSRLPGGGRSAWSRSAGGSGTPIGQLIGDAAEGAALREQGFDVLAYADVWVFERALRERVDALRPPPTP